MELGAKLKQARLEAGLSQRQLCGEEITRNMLSQIENGSAHPSMATLRYLAGRLGKPVSFFLEENVVTSANQAVMERARAAFRAGDFRGLDAALEDYREPDPIFDEEKKLLTIRGLFAMAEKAAAQNRRPFAAALLERIGELGRECAYYGPEQERRRLLLLAEAEPRQRQELCDALPSIDEELLIRAEAALDRGFWERCERLLEAAENRTPRWNFIRGQAHLARGRYEDAAICLRRAESEYPEQTAALLERCYRELGDFRQAYYYACRRRENGGGEV